MINIININLKKHENPDKALISIAEAFNGAYVKKL
jgi:hypothetical protein